MTEHVVIVGAGQAGVQAAFSLRDEGYDGEITLVSAEPGLPYQRPPLSKSYLLGKLGEEGVLLKAAELYGDYRLTLMEAVTATTLDRGARRVGLSNGTNLAYDHLVLATGARARALDTPGAHLNGVLALRTIADARGLMARLAGTRRAVVIGAGFIGLEFAAVARTLGVDVTVVELAPRVMGRALSSATAQFFEGRHVDWGVRFHFGATVRACHGGPDVEAVELSDGVRLPAELVLVGIGVHPNTELAEAAGLAVENGVLVDACLRTVDPQVFAIGDCARHPNRFCGPAPARLESVQNATDQGRCVAAAIVGRPSAYDTVPWFWSDQQDLKLQIAGVAQEPDTTVIRGSTTDGAFSVFCFEAGRLVAVESVNRGPDHIMARRLLAAGAEVDPVKVADETVPLRTFLAAAQAQA